MMRRLRQEESGWALVISVLVMTLLLGVGIAGLAFVDGQSRQSGTERVSESAFNLTQGALKSQLFEVSRNWPGSAGSAYTACTSAAAATSCPDPGTLAAQFSGSDYGDASWATAIQDNGGAVASYYTAAGAASQPAYDANGDGKLWVRATATTRGATRAVVTLVSAKPVPIPFPNGVVTADHFAVTNGGNKAIVDTNGSSYLSQPGQPAAVTVRCSGAPPSLCLNYDPTKGQVSPPAYENAYPTATAVSPEQLEQMRGIARKASTYYPTCPSNPSGALVFVESGNCSYNGGTYNSLASPGMLVVASGTLTLGGNALFHGLVYAANLQGSSGDVVTLAGTSQIVGAVAVDGAGGVLAGSSALNIAYNPNVFNLAQGYGNATQVKGTWRELAG
jgi:Tfp pilus assembly protein PilX